MGTIATEYLRKMQGYPTREEIAPIVDATIKKAFGESYTSKLAKPTTEQKAVSRAHFKEALKALTEEEISAEYKISEADGKEVFPKEKMIAKMSALIKKVGEKNKALVSAAQKAQAQRPKLKKNASPENKNKAKAQNAKISKELKKIDAEHEKNTDIMRRASQMRMKLKQEKSEWNKKRKEKSKQTKKAA
jgi:hypothetical protein